MSCFTIFSGLIPFQFLIFRVGSRVHEVLRHILFETASVPSEEECSRHNPAR